MNAFLFLTYGPLILEKIGQLKVWKRLKRCFQGMPAFQGFLYHTWAESLVNGQWVAIDPTFHQIPADATHIKLVEGENPSELLPLVNLIGKINYK